MVRIQLTAPRQRMNGLRRNDVHVPAESDFEEGQPAFGVRGPERAHAIDDEAVVGNGGLETLQSVPCKWSAFNGRAGMCTKRCLQVMLGANRADPSVDALRSHDKVALTSESRFSS